MSSNREKILSIVTGGIVVALSFLLSNLKIFEMPMGGSVTPASLLPLVVYAIAFGPGWGSAAAIVFSVLQIIAGLEWFVTPFQMFLDYVLGYTAYGITGFAALPAERRLKLKNPLMRFANGGIIKGFVFVILAYTVRWFCSVLSGVIFYAEYAGDMNPSGQLLCAFDMSLSQLIKMTIPKYYLIYRPSANFPGVHKK